jgi:nitrate/nitrite transport system ATP-binding protein
MSNGPHAKIAEIVEITMPRSRTRAEIHHDPQYYRIRNHLVDFLVNRSKTYAGAEAETFHDAKNPPVVPRTGRRPGRSAAMPRGKPATELKQAVNH